MVRTFSMSIHVCLQLPAMPGTQDSGTLQAVWQGIAACPISRRLRCPLMDGAQVSGGHAADPPNPAIFQRVSETHHIPASKRSFAQVMAPSAGGGTTEVGGERGASKAKGSSAPRKTPKKLAHNRAERERTRRINDAVQRLRVAADTTESDKASILVAAAKRLEQLREIERQFYGGRMALGPAAGSSDSRTGACIGAQPVSAGAEHSGAGAGAGVAGPRPRVGGGRGSERMPDGLPLLFDSLFLGAAVLDAESRLLAANDCFARALGRERSMLVGAPLGQPRCALIEMLDQPSGVELTSTLKRLTDAAHRGMAYIQLMRLGFWVPVSGPGQSTTMRSTTMTCRISSVSDMGGGQLQLGPLGGPSNPTTPARFVLLLDNVQMTAVCTEQQPLPPSR
jgi:hypothetical protein